MINSIRFSLVAILISLSFFNFSCSKKEESKTDDEQPILEAQKDIVAAKEYLGICYGPYHYDGQAPGTPISKAQLEEDLSLIARNFTFLRTYTVADGMDQLVGVAASKGLEVALGVHCYPNNEAQTKADINKAIQQIKSFPNTVLGLIVGNETNLRGPNFVEPATVANYMRYAHERLSAEGIELPITSCITGVGADSQNTYPNEAYCGPILQQCKDLNTADNRVILMTIYPYYGNGQPDNIHGNMEWSYQHGMANAEKNFGLGVIIGEIGWPTGVGNNGTATGRENVQFAEKNFKATLNWVNGNNFKNQAYNSFWFAMFDEPWKTDEPNGVGPSWGLYEKNGKQTSKFPIPSLN